MATTQLLPIYAKISQNFLRRSARPYLVGGRRSYGVGTASGLLSGAPCMRGRGRVRTGMSDWDALTRTKRAISPLHGGCSIRASGKPGRFTSTSLV